MGYLVSLNSDRFFKRVFSHLRIAKKFLEDFLGKKIESIELIETNNKKNKITDKAQSVFFDFRCKIEGQFIIIEMQQWDKQDIVQRFYLYHCLNTGLQLENLPEKAIIFDSKLQKDIVIKDYRRIEPVLTLIWMVDDNFGFKGDFMGYTLTAEIVMEFINNNELWKSKNIEKIVLEHQEILETIKNKTRDIDFLSKNRLVFAFQNNIVENHNLLQETEHEYNKEYEKWFEFAARSKKEQNTENDFIEYREDEIFNEMIEILMQEKLSRKDKKYLVDEQEKTARVKRWEAGHYHDGKIEGIIEGEIKGEIKGRKEGRKEGIIEGEKLGIEKGAKSKALKIAKSLLESNIDVNVIIMSTGLTKQEIENIKVHKDD